MRRPHWAVTVGRGIGVALVLFAALDVRDLAAAIGVRIPGLPMASYAGSSMDNLLAVALALLAWFALRPRDARFPVSRLFALGASGWKGPLLVLLASLPFWVGCAFIGKLQASIDWRGILFTALLFPLAEELVFRGFGFVFPRKLLGWPMVLAVLLQAVAFGWVHWEGMRGSELALQVFLITFLGGIVFAVLDAMNGYTLWCGWVLHVSLNAAWDVFDVAPSAATGWLGNGLRVLCAVLAVGFVAWRLRAVKGAAARLAGSVPVRSDS